MEIMFAQPTACMSSSGSKSDVKIINREMVKLSKSVRVQMWKQSLAVTDQISDVNFPM